MLRRLSTVLCFLALGLAAERHALAQKAIVLVRHAEKVDESKDPGLSPAGEERARSLARRLKDAGITAIVVSEYQRTQLTAAPLARELKITPEVVSAKKAEDTVTSLRGKHATDVVLVIGHSNSIPEVLKKLGVPGDVDLGDEYDNLFVVVPKADGPPVFLRMRF